MVHTYGLARKDLARETLFAIGMRFLPEFQEFKVSVVAHVLLRNLHLLQAHNGPATLKAVLEVRTGKGMPQLHRQDAMKAAELLEEKGYVSMSRQGKRVHITLTEAGRTYFAKSDTAFVNLVNDVCIELFGDIETADHQWSRAFVRLLCGLFSELGREYVGILTARAQLGDVLGEHSLRKLARKATRGLGKVDVERLVQKVELFLSQETPENIHLKWNLAQGYFALRVLGAGKASSEFSLSVLKGKVLYLDTNVLFPILVKSLPHQQGVALLERLCQKAGVQVCVSRPTVDELLSSLTRQIEDVRQMVSKIPDVLANKIADPVYLAVAAARTADPSVDVEKVLQRFSQPVDELKKAHNIRINDDPWFSTAWNSPEVRNLARHVADTYLQIRRIRRKSEPIARHDAIMLLYVAKEQAREQDVLFLTLDTSLPFCRVPEVSDGKPLAVTLDAFLQWVHPALLNEADQAELGAVFAAALAERFLPTDRYLHLSHFRLLDDFGIQCKLLPAEDVQGCIDRLQRVILTVDPSTSEGREKVYTEMKSFLVSPERRYRKDLAKEKEQREQVEEELALLKRRFKHVREISIAIVLVGAGLGIAFALGEGSTFGKRILNNWLFTCLSAPFSVLVPRFLSRMLKKR